MFLVFIGCYVILLDILPLFLPTEREEVEALVSQYDTVVKQKESFTRECKEKVKGYRCDLYLHIHTT